jgi:hypothetical protein
MAAVDVDRAVDPAGRTVTDPPLPRSVHDLLSRPLAGQDPAMAVVRSRLAASPLVAGGGAATTRLLDERWLQALRTEAEAGAAKASAALVEHPRDEDTKRGDPDRWIDWTTGGASLDAFYTSPAVLAFLERLTSVRWMPSGAGGTYTYYRRAGHHLGLHRDVDQCDLALITCVWDEGRPIDGLSGVLRLYPTRVGERLSDVRRTPGHGATDVSLIGGETLVLLGGIIPHTLLPMAAGHSRVVAPLCYRLAGVV